MLSVCVFYKANEFCAGTGFHFFYSKPDIKTHSMKADKLALNVAKVAIVAIGIAAVGYGTKKIA